MGMFLTTDIENAADDPFALKEGRQVVIITASEEDTINSKDGDEYRVWKVTVANQDDELEQDVLFFLDGDEKQLARTNSNIKKMLVALEIPTSEWKDVSENPGLLVDKKVTVEAVKAKKSGRIFVNWIGVPVPEAGPDSTGLDTFKDKDLGF